MKQSRILALINREDLIGRDAELRAIAQRISSASESRGLVLMAAPGAGASELLRQAYDQLFLRRSDSAPLHFAFQCDETSDAETARLFFKSCLQQFIPH